MEDFKFTTLKELYKKLYPALNTKKNELKRKGINVTEEDIWTYNRLKSWNTKQDLTLYDLVSDIMSTPDEEIESYLTKKK